MNKRTKKGGKRDPTKNLETMTEESCRVWAQYRAGRPGPPQCPDVRDLRARERERHHVRPSETLELLGPHVRQDDVRAAPTLGVVTTRRLSPVGTSGPTPSSVRRPIEHTSGSPTNTAAKLRIISITPARAGDVSIAGPAGDVTEQLNRCQGVKIPGKETADEFSLRLLKQAMTELGLNERIDTIWSIAGSIAALAGSPHIRAEHITEAVMYQPRPNGV